MTMMRDISLRGRKDVSQERVVNKLQDWVYDDVLGQFVMLPQVGVCRFGVGEARVWVIRCWLYGIGVSGSTLDGIKTCVVVFTLCLILARLRCRKKL